MDQPQITPEAVGDTTVKSFEGRLPRLDAVLGTPPSTEPPAPEPTKEPEEKGIRKIGEPEKKEPEATTPPETTKEPEKQTTETKAPEPEPEVNLGELVIEHNGQERSVLEVLEEQAAAITAAQEAKTKLDEIEKDPFLKDFIAHYLANGSAAAYLEARGVDYDKKTDLDVLKMKFDKDHADFSEKARGILWKKELTEKYKISDELSDEEKQSDEYLLAQELFARDAKNARQGFKDQQAKFQISERKPAEEKPATPQFDPQAYKQKLLQQKEVDAFSKSKLLKLGVTDEAGNAFGLEPSDPEGIIEMMTDDRKFWGQFTKDGKLDYNKQMKVYAFAMNPEEYERQLVEFGKDLYLQERLKEEKNIDGRLNRQTTEAQTQTKSQSEAILQAALKAKQSLT